MIIISINLFLAAFMTGLVWFVQLIHYPLMHEVQEPGFRGYHHEHTRKVKWLVGPIMVAELVSAVALIVERPRGLSLGIAWLLLGAVVAIWLSTFIIQAEPHKRLSEGFSRNAHRRLISTNWIRTMLWSARTGVLTTLAAQAVLP